MSAASMVHKANTFATVTDLIIDNYFICFATFAVNYMLTSFMWHWLFFADNLNIFHFSALGYFNPGWDDICFTTYWRFNDCETAIKKYFLYRYLYHVVNIQQRVKPL